MLNRITLVGRLTKDAELRKTQDDRTIVNFDIAVDNAMKEQDGTRGTCFLTCKALGNLGDALANVQLNKGEKVAIDGSLQQRNFVRADGSKGHAIEVIIDSVEFMTSKVSENKPVEEAEEAEEVTEPVEEPQQEPLFDPYTGKPLKKVAKNSKK